MLTVSNSEGVQLQAKLFRGFGDPARLNILQTLRSGPKTVTEIVSATCMSQSNASNHLRCLRECGLVAAEQQGKYVHYRLSDDRVGDLLTMSESLLSDVALGVYECTRYNLPHKKSLAHESGENR
ncbi:MAG: helix-turn-helix transcriptional regulator [Anaerolineae bacterium]|nr:helix-turn-helix transcriptional regulator [Anaerolineae bacterium]BCY16644.1 transcriptional regulator [Leptolinea sp. HRD-7]